jgi:hypothetical protein
MRVGTRYGRFYFSQHIGCLPVLLFAGFVVGVGGALAAAIVESMRNAATRTSTYVWIGFGLAAVCALIWLCVYLGHRPGPSAGVDPDGDPIRPYAEDH